MIFQLTVKGFFFHMLQVGLLRFPAAHGPVEGLGLHCRVTGDVPVSYTHLDVYKRQSLARLLAHGSEDDTQLFVMQESDRQFAIDYYYTHLISQHGISYPAYRNTLDLFFFYEYCEWVYVGNRYGNTNSTNYQRYLPLALRQAEHILNIQ